MQLYNIIKSLCGAGSLTPVASGIAKYPVRFSGSTGSWMGHGVALNQQTLEHIFMGVETRIMN
jgi:hypothetical protein